MHESNLVINQFDRGPSIGLNIEIDVFDKEYITRRKWLVKSSTLAMLSSVWQQRGYVTSGERGRDAGPLTRMDRLMPIRTKSSLHKRDAKLKQNNRDPFNWNEIHVKV